MPDLGPMLGRKAQVDGKLGEVVQDAGHRPWVALPPRLGKALGATAGLGQRGLARLGRQVVEDPPVVGLDQLLVGGTDLGQDIAGAVLFMPTSA